MLKKLLTITMLAALLIWAVGCSESPTQPTDQTEILNLNDATGGYQATNESPGFGDSDLLAETDENAEYDDPILLAGAVDSLMADTAAGIYHLRILWGQMRFNSTVTNVTDWTGSLTVSRGGMVIRRVIRFEPGQDVILERTDRKLVEWESITTVHNDGLAVDIFVPPDTAISAEAVTVSFETGPYSRTFNLSELIALDTVVYVGDADSNAVAFEAFRLDHVPCPRGFLAGRWGYNDEGEGVFRGVWMTRNGLISGFLNGSFGVNDNGQNVFFGKWIGVGGRFHGFIRGRWEQHPNDHGNMNAVRNAGGRFMGEILDANRQVIGVLGGHYKSHPEFKKGFFQGRWKLACNEVEANRDDGL